MADQGAYQVIISKVYTPDYHQLALAAGGDGYVYQAILNYQDPGQAWSIRPERDGSCFSIFSKSQQKYIAKQDNVDALILVGRDQVDNGTNALWRNEGDPSNWHLINSLTDWEQKMNVLGNGPYVPGKIVFTWSYGGGADNEMWQTRPIYRTASIQDLTFASDFTITSNQPQVAAYQQYSNNTGQQQEQTVTLKFVQGKKYSFTQSQQTKISESIEFKAGIPEVGSATTKVTIEGTYKFSSDWETEEEDEISVDVPLVVPPYKAYEARVLVLSGSIVIGYSANVVYTYPDGSSETVPVSGYYSCENGWDFLTTAVDLGTPVRVERRRLNRLTATQVQSRAAELIEKALVSTN